MMDDTIKINDKTFVLHPLTLGDTKRFLRYVQFQKWANFQGLKEQLPAEIFNAESQRLLTECANKPVASNAPEVSDIEKTPEGLSYLVCLSLKHTYPQMTTDEVEEMLTPANLKEVISRVFALSGLLKKKIEPVEAEGQLIGESITKKD